MKVSWIVLFFSFLLTLITSLLILTLSDDFGYKYYTFFQGNKFPSKDNQIYIWLLIYIVLAAIGMLFSLFILILNFIKVDKLNTKANYTMIVLGVLILIFGIFLLVGGSKAQSSDKEAIISLSLISVFLPLNLASIILMSGLQFKGQKI
ncbi:hypothetical protein SCORR_v1c04430 [Spiroplasma corruscae]|uniref:Uncharacterized protein n=1 Tax=Spiroplasma corruscae TaxID=216934 RepID=A0A222ENZ7_9MOLU|nr:hypothetical protein [Spiroplasma corruscae]ASP28217.1 hypothetical protein SCORR_v1c04430 [Spiroplasma corruscae]